MYLKLLFLSLSLTINCQDYDNGEKATAELEIANLELQDDCENVATVLKSALVSNTFSEKIKVRKAHGELVKVVAANLKPLEGEIPSDLLRNWTFFEQAGDELLNEQDWNTLVSFDVTNDEIMHTAAVHCKNDSTGCVFVKRGYDNILEESRNATLLKTAWSRWQTLVSRHEKQFPDVLSLVSKAASLNGKEDAKSYWEMLVEQEDSYRVADELWEQIKPLYFKLQNFVKRRLFHFYNVTNAEDSDIPVYLLGSNFGNDWSKIAGLLLPYPLLYQISEAHLNKTTIQDVYKSADQLTRDLKIGPLGPKFWSNSVFNLTFCENHVISFCADEHSELLTCDKSSWTSYLDSYEVAIDVALRNMDYLSLARSNLRESVINDAIVGMGSVLAVKDMRYRVWGRELFMGSMLHTNEMMELMLIALRVLPKLPYYLVADKWRLEALQHGFEEFEERWWKLRREYQGVGGVTNEEADFMADSYITSNRPYLSKFLGTILQFQFLEYYKNDWDGGNSTITENIANDPNFLDLLHERSSTEWGSLIINHHSFYDLSTSSLLDFFYPLSEFLDSAPIEQVLQTIPKPPTTTAPPTIAPKDVNKEAREHRKHDEENEPPLPPHHEHVEENLEGPNPSMEVISMYIGIALLVAVAGIILFVIVSKKLRKKRSNNRRFET